MMRPRKGSGDLWTARAITLDNAPKRAGEGAHRPSSAAYVWKRVRPLLQSIGVTRLTDITGLDRLGVPTSSCIRPSADRFSVSVTCGKGLSAVDAMVGAAMEAIECYCAEPHEAKMVVATAANLEGPSVDPHSLNLPSWAVASAHSPIP